MSTGILMLVIGIALMPFAFWYDKHNKKATNNKGKKIKPLHRRWWMWALAVLLIFSGFVTIGGVDDSSSTASHPVSHKAMRKAYKKELSDTQNMPGQRINPARATKHEFYWTNKSDKHVRYFVSSKKITAIKYKYNVNWQNNTTDSQGKIENILHDSNLRYGNDKQKEDNTLLSNHKSYNLYSPAHKKWYWVRFDAGLKKDTVASFAIYPGKSPDAE